jgi:hypothetical protein
MRLGHVAALALAGLVSDGATAGRNIYPYSGSVQAIFAMEGDWYF